MVRADIRVRTVRTPILHETLEGIIAARFGGRAPPQLVCRFVILLLQQFEELAGLVLLAKVLEEEIEKPKRDQRYDARDDQPLDSLFPLLLAHPVICEIAGHRESGMAIWKPDKLCYTPPWLQR